MRVMRHRPVLATNATGFLIGIAMFGSFMLIPQFAQTPEASGYGFGMTDDRRPACSCSRAR